MHTYTPMLVLSPQKIHITDTDFEYIWVVEGLFTPAMHKPNVLYATRYYAFYYKISSKKQKN